MAEKKAQMGDFIGFSFNGIHSSELGLVRVSDGNRYEKNLFPAISDKTVQVPGRDGFYYFGSSYNTREMTVKVAFDNLEEQEFRAMVEHFKDKKPHFLWFDELPYKEYLVKIKNPPNFKYLCFDEDGKRIYKGEGTIIFVCYSPYARARAKSLTDSINEAIIKNEDLLFDIYHNTILDGTNQIDNDNIPIYPPRINDNNYYLTKGQDIRNYLKSGYLKLFKEKDREKGNELFDNKLLYYNFCKNIVPFFVNSNEENPFPNNILINQDQLNTLLSNVTISSDLYDYIIKLMMICADTEETFPEQDLSLMLFYNLFEWNESSRLPLKKSVVDEENNDFEINNCGDIEMNTKILLTGLNNGECIVNLKDKEKIINSITIDCDKLQQELDRRGEQGKDKARNPYGYFFLDSQTKLLQAYDTCESEGNVIQPRYNGTWESEKETKNVFNNCIIANDFFKIPADNTNYTIEVTNGELVDVEYTYLYY